MLTEEQLRATGEDCAERGNAPVAAEMGQVVDGNDFVVDGACNYGVDGKDPVLMGLVSLRVTLQYVCNLYKDFQVSGCVYQTTFLVYVKYPKAPIQRWRESL